MNPVPKAPEPSEVTLSAVERTRLGLPPSVLAGMACVIPFVGQIGLGVIEREQPFIVRYALQALIYWIVAASLLWVYGQMTAAKNWAIDLLFIVLFFPFLIVGLALAVTLLIMASNAFSGNEWTFPGLRRVLDRAVELICR